MKTKLLLIVMLFVLVVSVDAQTKPVATENKLFTMGIGGMIGIPVGNSSTGVFNSIYGFDLTGEYHIAPSIGLTLSAGYSEWSMKQYYKDYFDAAGESFSTGLVPVLAGVKYYFDDKVYGSVQAGLSFYTQSGVGNAFTNAYGVGYKVSDKLDLSLIYEITGNDGGEGDKDQFLGLRAGITF
jgi:hypothetical protein